MLSNTYIRIVCANENNRIRKLLERLCGEKDKTDVMDEAATLYSLVEKIEQERRARRFDKFILPFIKADDPGTGILEKMEELRKDISVCVVLLQSVLKEAIDNGTIDRQVFAPEIQRYCDLKKNCWIMKKADWACPAEVVLQKTTGLHWPRVLLKKTKNSSMIST